MSNEALTWAWQQRISDPEAKLLLIRLADQANKDGVCWPSRGSLAEDCGMSESTVKRRIGVLREAGLLSVQQRRREGGLHSSNLYLLPVNGGSLVTHGDAEHGGSAVVHNGGSTVTHEPSVEPTLVGSEPNGSSPTRQRSRTPRPRDELWDVLEAEIGVVTNELERGRRNKALKALRESEATPEQVKLAIVAYRKRWPGVEMTALAIASNWALLVQEVGAPPEERARAWVQNVGWQYPSAALAEELARFDLASEQEQQLIALASSLQTANGP